MVRALLLHGRGDEFESRILPLYYDMQIWLSSLSDKEMILGSSPNRSTLSPYGVMVAHLIFSQMASVRFRVGIFF